MMENLKKMLIVLKCSDMGELVIAYLRHILKVLNPNNLYFMIIKPFYEFPSSILKHFPKIDQSMDKETRLKVKNTIRSLFSDFQKNKLHFIFSQENIMQDIIETVRTLNIDLLVMEKEYPEFGSSIFSEKVIRKATCSVLIISGKSLSKPKNLLVPVDFSENSANALKFALTFTKITHFKLVYCLHFYTVPFSLSHTGIDLERFHKIMKNNSADDFEDYLQQFVDSKMSITHLLEPNTDPMVTLKDIISVHKIDLIIMANRGRGSTPVMLGDLTETIIKSVEIPVLVLKNKKQNMSRLYTLYKSLGLK